MTNNNAKKKKILRKQNYIKLIKTKFWMGLAGGGLFTLG